MNLDDAQGLWQSQDSRARITIDSELLLKEVRRNEQSFRASVFWRDVREIGVAVVMAVLFIYWGLKSDLWPWFVVWPLFVVALSMLWVAGFMLVDRIRHKRATAVFGESLAACTERSLAQVDHQIWLLENVFWWYLLPPGAAIELFFAWVAWQLRDLPWTVLATTLAEMAIALVLFYGVYRLNQYAVRTYLRPRQLELKALLASLKEG